MGDDTPIEKLGHSVTKKLDHNRLLKKYRDDLALYLFDVIFFARHNYSILIICANHI